MSYDEELLLYYRMALNDNVYSVYSSTQLNTNPVLTIYGI